MKDWNWYIFTWVLQALATIPWYVGLVYTFKRLEGHDLSQLEFAWFLGCALVMNIINEFFRSCRKNWPKKEAPKTVDQVVAGLRESQDKVIIKLVREGKIVRVVHDEIVVYDR